MPLGFSQLGPAILTINYLPSLHHPWNAAPPLEKLENQIKWSDKLVNTPSWLSLFKVLQCTLKEKRKKLLPTMLYFLPTCYTPCLTILNFIYIYFFFFNSFLFIWLHRVLAVVCWIQFPNQGSNPGQAPLSMGFSNKNTGMSCHFHLQGIFPTQGWNPCLLHLLH